MTNRFVCTKCRMNISEIELSSAKATRTRYDSKIHTFCPYCDTHITSFNSDKYENALNNLTKIFTSFGCRILCYYEGNVEQSKTVVDYKPPIFRMMDTENKLFYRLACKIKHANKIELDDIFIVDEEDGSFSIIGGTETWYFDVATANKDLDKYLDLVKRMIYLMIKLYKKYKNMEV